MPTQNGGTGDDTITAPMGGQGLASSDAAGVGGNSWTDYGVVSPDGTLIAFVSNATNLVAGDTNGVYELYIKNIVTGEVKRVLGLGGAEPNDWTTGRRGIFSEDGTKFYFSSFATNLTTDDTQGKSNPIYVLDIATMAVSVVYDSLGQSGWAVDGYAWLGDDAWVTRTDFNQLSLWDLATGEQRELIRGTDGEELNEQISSFSVSPDGAFVLFSSYATNLPGEDEWNSSLNVFRLEVATGVITRVPIGSPNAYGQIGQAESANYHNPTYTSDGAIWFLTDDESVVANDTNGQRDIFRYDPATGAFSRLVNESGQEFNDYTFAFVVSPNGDWVLVSSFATNIVPGSPSGPNIYMINVATGEGYFVARGTFYEASFSDDGGVVAYSTNDSADPSDTNNDGDIYYFAVPQPLSSFGGDGVDRITGGGGDDELDGGAGDDFLVGGAGNDLLAGGLGSDDMRGGLGDDTYIVTGAGDVVTETAGQGVDHVKTTISYTLTDFVENLTLMYAQSIDGTGNGLDNVINGNGAANVLRGLAGDDTLNGGSGNDTLEGGDNNDTLDGGAGNDQLSGGAGIDILLGGAGNDRLDGGAGADRMEGGLGGDTYVVDDAGDVIIEGTDSSVDSVEAWVSHTLAANVENLTLMGGNKNDGTGNAGKNVITGNGVSNILSGLAGDDTLDGGGGNDVLIGGAGADRLTGGAGADTFRFSNDDVGAALVTDRVLDLSFADGDVIDLSGLDGAFAQLSFVNKFSKVAGQATLAVSGGVTIVNIDLNGDGKADYRIEVNGDLTGTTGNLYTGPGDTNGGWVL